MKALITGLIVSVSCIGLAEAKSKVTGEKLMVTLPTGYELGDHQKTDEGEISEFIPKGETVENWKDMITVQLLPSENSNEKFYSAMDSMVKKVCTDGSTSIVATAEENGYPIKFFQMYCPTNPQTKKGEATFIKTIEGKDKFYVVQKAWRTDRFEPGRIPLDRDGIVNWSQYLKSVYVCDDRIKGRKCP